MCGGVKEFESLRAPAPQMISLLHEEIRQYECGERSYVDDSLCYAPVLKLSNARDQNIKTHEVVVEAAPAGLAIVAAMAGSELLVQSVPVTKSDHFSTNPEKHINVQQSHSRAPAGAGLMVKPAGRQACRGHGSALASSPMSSSSRPKQIEEKARKNSVFCSAFSPRKDLYIDSRAPVADFMGTCFLCQRSLGSGMDIYMYRGDRAFCSSECRYQHMVEDELSERLQQQNLSVSEATHCNDKFASPSPVIHVLG